VANPNWPTAVWQWDPAYGPTEGTRRWRSLTARVAGTNGAQVYTTSFGRQYELGTQETGTCTVQIDNKDELLTPGNLASPFQAMSGWQLRQTTSTTAPGLPTNTLQFSTPIQVGSLVVVVTVGTAAVTVGSNTATLPTWRGKSFTQLKSVTAGSYTLTMWASVATSGGNILVGTQSAGTWTAVALEYVGAGSVDNLDVTAAATLTGGSYTSVTTGTTAAATAGDLLIVSAAPANYAAAATPTAPAWGASTQRVAAASPGSGTAANNSLVFVADQLDVTAGAKSDTASWTNTAGTALGMAVTIRQSPTIELGAPPAGSMALIPYRPIRHWAMWPPLSTPTGNLLNATNNQWSALGSVPGSYADTAGFEGGTGTWAADQASSIATSGTRAHDGTQSMVVTWPTAGSGAAYCSTDLPPVETGHTYTISAWVYVPAGAPAVRLQWGLTNGTASSTTDAWERVSVTKTRTDAQDDRLYLLTAASSTSGQQVWVDSVQVEINAAGPSTFTTTGSTIYPIHSGHIERYPETWTHAGFRGWESVTSVDPLALLPAVTLSDCMTEDIMQDAPAFYWPFDDTPSSGFCRPQAPFYGNEWVNNFFLGVPSLPSDYTLGVAGGPGVDGGACVEFAAVGSSQPNVWLGPGFAAGPLYAVNDIGAGVTWELWFQTTATTQAVIAEIDADSGQELSLQISASGQVTAASTDPFGSPLYTLTDPGVSNDGTWHYLAVTEHASGGTVTATLQVDARVVGTATYAAAAGMQTAQIGLAWGFNSTGHPFAGRLSRFAIYPAALSADRRRSHWASSLGFPWDTSGQRVSRVLAWMPWNGHSSVPPGITQAAPASGQSGRTVQDVINGCQTAENGPFLATPVGVLTLIGRDTYYLNQTATVVFGEDTVGGEIPYQADVSAGTDITYIANTVTVIGASGTPQTVTDAPSQTLFGPRSLQVSTSHGRDQDALLLAQHLLNLYKTPRMRVIAISINPGANPALWPVALGLKFGDRVTFKRRTSAGVTISFDGFVDRIQHDVDVGSWTTRFQISPVDPNPPLILGDATYGVLGQNFIKY